VKGRGVIVAALLVAVSPVAAEEPPALCAEVLERLEAGESEAALVDALTDATPVVSQALAVSDCLADAGASLTVVAAALPGVRLELETGSCLYTNNAYFGVVGEIRDVCVSQHLKGLIERVHQDWAQQLAPAPPSPYDHGPRRAAILLSGDFYPNRIHPNPRGASGHME